MIKPDSRIIPTTDEFESWTQHPVTRFVAAAWEAAALAQRDDWLARSWGGSNCDPLELRTLQTRADAYSAFLETGLEQYVGIVQKDR